MLPTRRDVPAPGFLGALFCSLFVFLASCDPPSETPDWGTSSTAAPAPESSSPSRPARASGTPSRTTATSGSSERELRFIAYNVQNWLTMDRYVDGRTLKGKPKADEEKAAVVTLLSRHRPDVIGISEIGTKRDLNDLRRRLAAAGLDLPHSHHAGGSDPVRHLGLLSRFPIVATASPAKTDYRIAGRNHSILRGIHDVTIKAHGKNYRFLGVHLKSKREVKEGDQEAMRRAEARLLRRHVDAILKKNPNARLIVYGDFNDTRPSPSFRSVTGQYNDPTYLTAIPARDSRGHSWTHCWSHQDVYSRFDFVTVSRAMKSDTDFRASHIIDDPEWEQASDHRPILAIFN